MILLQHIGDIVKFDLDVSGVRLTSFIDIDRWMLFVTRNGVKKLTLKMSKTINTTYKVPSYIFNCRTLEHLTLFNCIFKPPKSLSWIQQSYNPLSTKNNVCTSYGVLCYQCTRSYQFDLDKV